MPEIVEGIWALCNSDTELKESILLDQRSVLLGLNPWREDNLASAL